jgi:hypothetical protein
VVAHKVVAVVAVVAAHKVADAPGVWVAVDAWVVVDGASVAWLVHVVPQVLVPAPRLPVHVACRWLKGDSHTLTHDGVLTSLVAKLPCKLPVDLHVPVPLP